MQNSSIAEMSFEIVSLAGDARATFLKMLDEAKEFQNKKNSEKQQIISELKSQYKEASELLIECHKKQTVLIQAEAQGKRTELSMLLIHAQDHLMTAMLLQDMVKYLLHLNGVEI